MWHRFTSSNLSLALHDRLTPTTPTGFSRPRVRQNVYGSFNPDRFCRSKLNERTHRRARRSVHRRDGPGAPTPGHEPGGSSSIILMKNSRLQQRKLLSSSFGPGEHQYKKGVLRIKTNCLRNSLQYPRPTIILQPATGIDRRPISRH